MFDEMFAPIMMGIVAIALILGGILFSDNSKVAEISTLCDREGQVVLEGYVYNCERVGRE